MENCKARQFLQPGQYCASYNRGAIPKYCLSILCQTLVLLLAWYSMAVLMKHWNKDVIDSWDSTGLLLPQYWLLLVVKYRQVSYSKLRYSNGLILAVNIIQILAISTGIGISLTVSPQLVYYWCTTDYHYWQNTDKRSTDMEVSSTVGILLVY